MMMALTVSVTATVKIDGAISVKIKIQQPRDNFFINDKLLSLIFLLSYREL